MPLPPLPPNEAEQHFYDHRADYEKVVELAKQGSLPRYTALNAAVQGTNPLVIIFDPLNDSYNYIAYAVTESDLEGTNPCDVDGKTVAHIGDTWWLCFRDWN